MSTTVPQITFLPHPPAPEKFERPRNPDAYNQSDLIYWLKRRYRGNKPFGGLWSSTNTPDDIYRCDWHRGLKTNKMIQMAMPPNHKASAYALQVDPAAKVLTIASLRDAEEFTQRYSRGVVPVPETLRVGPGRLITRQQTDWERALADWDGIRLTGQAADEIMYALTREDKDTAFHTWNCESTLWGRWRFSDVKAL